MVVARPTLATILGNPAYWSGPYRDHNPAQLAALRELGVDILFINLAWSRPWIDAVTLEHVVISPSYPWLSDPVGVAEHQTRLRQRVDAALAAGLRPFFLFGCPAQVDLAKLPAEAQAPVQALIGSPVSRIDRRLSPTCIQAPEVRRLYRELLAEFLRVFPETAGFLFYTVDELAEVCDEADDCPRCHGVPLHERLPDFLAALRAALDQLKPGIEMWWEPWEFTAAQTYAVTERLAPGIKLALHSNIHEVYYTNQPDQWLRYLCRVAADRGIEVIAETFWSATGEDLGPLPGYPCPRLVHDGLRALLALPAVTGIKEYFGTVAEQISINERVAAATLRDHAATYTEIVEPLARAYGDGVAPALLTAWEQAARAVESFPWDVSWRLRLYNTVRYDQGFGGAWDHTVPADQRTARGYWDHSFTHSLPTPWTTPSWESSRGAAYIVSLSLAVVNGRLLAETAERLARTIAHADAALAGLEQALSLAAAGQQPELARQADAVRMFRHLTLGRALHLRASLLAEQLRATPDAAIATSLADTLRADQANATDLLRLIRAGSYEGYDLAVYDATLLYMATQLSAYDRDPIAWAHNHLL